MRPRRAVAGVWLTLAAVVGLTACTQDTTWFRLSDPINRSQLTDLPFGTRSFWLQPWRSSLTTRPATSLEDALGLKSTCRRRRWVLSPG